MHINWQCPLSFSLLLLPGLLTLALARRSSRERCRFQGNTDGLPCRVDMLAAPHRIPICVCRYVRCQKVSTLRACSRVMGWVETVPAMSGGCRLALVAPAEALIV
ncbi:hypothetical protein GGS23DRAFT_477949 [Durotheca rogersii]|uniref:uncharacterized protein n=1 Tax=Durotheca rogersii TaxID=419775 RepID=UPI00221F4A59|nr:uncharacterized protein GGS23DRAFT_477949 [Durotheca rogersii]KAI5864001.1 hypothetical protein GGS23DRAFT_477949 [Durotheca rogersii]